MSDLVDKTSKKAGLPPGTPVFIGEKKAERVRIKIIDFDETHFQEKEVETVEECFPFKDTPTVTWINIDGIHQVETIEKICNHFNIHPLVLEDIVNTRLRPKMEDFGNYIFIVLKMFYHNEEKDELTLEQVSLILGSNFVISFQEAEGDVFNPIRERIRNGKGRIRKGGADYLAYALLDSIVDSYFVVLEKTGEKLEFLDEEVVANPTPELLQTIRALKRDMLFARRSVWPLRELVSGLQRTESQLIKKPTKLYLRDIYEHTIQVIDNIETFRDLTSGMLEIYLSSISHKLNEVMKLLTIMASIFIPLTFIAGIYGMNFQYMPELEWHWGYPSIMLVMAAMGILMVAYFKIKKWL